MIRAILAALALALLVPAATAAQAEPVIRIGAGPDMTSLPIIYADKAGLFKKAGLNVDIQKLGGASVVGAALAGGSLDIGKGSTLSVATGFGRGLPFTIIGAIAAYNGDKPDLALIVLANSEVKTAKDLVGKVLADVSLQDMNTVATLAWLDQHGVDSASLKYVEIPATAALPAMESGRVVGSTVYEPIYTADMATGKVRVIGYPFDAISKHFVDSVLFANVNWVNAHRDLVERFLRVMKTATAYVGTHEDELTPVLAEYAGVDPVSIAKVHRPERRVTISAEDVQPVIDTAAKYKAIPKAFPATDLICSCALKP
jgi:NitT/TauT family transport system substrate-binding protein